MTKYMKTPTEQGRDLISVLVGYFKILIKTVLTPHPNDSYSYIHKVT